MAPVPAPFAPSPGPSTGSNAEPEKHRYVDQALAIVDTIDNDGGDRHGALVAIAQQLQATDPGAGSPVIEACVNECLAVLMCFAASDERLIVQASSAAHLRLVATP